MSHRGLTRTPGASTLVFLPLLLGVGGCEDSDSSTQVQPPLSIDQVTFADELGVDLSQMRERPNGLWLQDEAMGDEGGEVVDEDTEVLVDFTGWLPDGQLVDSSEGSQPIRFRPGDGRLISGFAQGVVGAREGGRRLLVIPPDLGFGAQGAGGGRVPPNSWLVFRVTVVEILSSEGTQ